jgi:hypothetical protein
MKYRIETLWMNFCEKFLPWKICYCPDCGGLRWTE